MNTNLDVVRVQDIILDNNHPRYLGENSIGTILYTPLNTSTPIDNDFTQLPTAKPLFYNISHYPIANEIVYILGAPTSEYNENNNAEAYYLPPISINKSPNNNAYPNVLDENGEFRLGEYFQEIENIRPLRPYEGDIMVEGRFGNSIRLGATSDNNIAIPNRWSNNGELGDPITIIRNGQTETNEGESFNHILEDINGDNSSIYLCSNQQLDNFIPSSTYQLSFGANLTLETKEEPIINNDEMPENIEEDIIMASPNNLPPEELQQSEINEVEEIEDPYYDIADTEDQVILSSNIDSDSIPDDLPDSIDFERPIG